MITSPNANQVGIWIERCDLGEQAIDMTMGQQEDLTEGRIIILPIILIVSNLDTHPQDSVRWNVVNEHHDAKNQTWDMPQGKGLIDSVKGYLCTKFRNCDLSHPMFPFPLTFILPPSLPYFCMFYSKH